MKTRSPATAGVEKTHPPASNVHEGVGSTLRRSDAALLGDERGAHPAAIVPSTTASRTSRPRLFEARPVLELPGICAPEGVPGVDLKGLAGFRKLEYLDELVGGLEFVRFAGSPPAIEILKCLALEDHSARAALFGNENVLVDEALLVELP